MLAHGATARHWFLCMRPAYCMHAPEHVRMLDRHVARVSGPGALPCIVDQNVCARASYALALRHDVRPRNTTALRRPDTLSSACGAGTLRRPSVCEGCKAACNVDSTRIRVQVQGGLVSVIGHGSE